MSQFDYHLLKTYSRCLCPTCGKSLSSIAHLKRHQRNHHVVVAKPRKEKQVRGKDVFTYICVLCEQEFPRKWMYEVHCQVKHQLQGVLRLVSI